MCKNVKILSVFWI